jgi:hypothetical protein
VAPEIAIDTGERAFGAGEEHGKSGNRAAARLALLFPKVPQRLPGIGLESGEPLRADPLGDFFHRYAW